MLLAGRGSAAAAVAALQALTFAQELRIVLLLLFFRRSLVFGRLRCPCALPNISASSAAFAAAREGLLSRSPPLPSPLSPLPSSLFSSPLAALSFRSPLFTSPPLPLFFSARQGLCNRVVLQPFFFTRKQTPHARRARRQSNKSGSKVV